MRVTTRIALTAQGHELDPRLLQEVGDLVATQLVSDSLSQRLLQRIQPSIIISVITNHYPLS